MSVKIYTIGNMDDAVVDSATSAATGYPMENLIDNNLDTRWKPTSTANQTIDIDLQAAYGFDYMYLFVHNYKSLTVGSVQPSYSDDDSSYSTASAVRAIGHALLVDAPHRLYSLSETDAHRYWRFIFTSLGSPLPEISAIWLCSEYDIGQSAEYPLKDSDSFATTQVKTGGDRVFSIVNNKRSSKILERTFLFPSSTNYTNLRSAFHYSRGNALPVVVQEGTAYNEIVVAKFKDAKFTDNQKGYQIYNPKITLEEMPYIDSGESY